MNPHAFQRKIELLPVPWKTSALSPIRVMRWLCGEQDLGEPDEVGIRKLKENPLDILLPLDRACFHTTPLSCIDFHRTTAVYGEKISVEIPHSEDSLTGMQCTLHVCFSSTYVSPHTAAYQMDLHLSDGAITTPRVSWVLGPFFFQWITCVIFVVFKGNPPAIQSVAQ